MIIRTEKSQKKYIVRYRDLQVMSIDCNSGEVIMYLPELVPFGLLVCEGSDFDSRLKNINYFYYWCSCGLLSLDRKYAKELLNSLGLPQAVNDRDRALIALSYHCLSLNDCYWISAFEDEVYWAEVSLFRSTFNQEAISVALKGRSANIFSIEGTVAQELGTQGIYTKAWLRREGDIYLCKTGNDSVDREVVASRIVECFDVDSVSYHYETIEGERVSICKCITSEEINITSMASFYQYCIHSGLSFKDEILGLDSRSYYAMNLIDYIVGNTDRHSGNWGIMYKVIGDRRIVMGLHPLLDFIQSFQKDDVVEMACCLPELMMGRRISQREAAEEALRKYEFKMSGSLDKEWFLGDEEWCRGCVERFNMLGRSLIIY